ncbi:MAG: mannose-1-phosphate guanylyltransferase [Bacteriovorax sp.]|nr:mannose-1-phosphate guanylyltransferase [Bacteriovorax sp.]
MSEMTKLFQFYALVMAGGKGTRFWPESTEKKPKQYLNLISSKTLLEETLDRFESLIEKDKRFIVTVKEQEDLCLASSHGKISKEGIIFEPSGRNTGPCILMSLASLLAKGLSEDDVVAIVPSDHVILNRQGFLATLKKAAFYSHQKKNIVTIGITPHFPHTGFGYIEKGEMVEGEAFKVSRFKEKPHFELAKEYVASGKYLWNAGMFVAPIGVLLEEFRVNAPKMFAHYDELKKAIFDPLKLKEVYERIPSDSIDYAIMEKSKKVSVIPATFDWNDMGSWDALSSVIDETHGNTLVKSDGAFFLNSADNVVFAPGKFVSLINMDKHIVVVNDKVVLVAPVKDSQEIKKVVEHLKVNRPDLI